MELPVLKVRPIPVTEDDFGLPALDPRLPKFMTISVFVGATRSGKTTLLINLLNQTPFFGSKFQVIIIFSSTIHMDPTWSGLHLLPTLWHNSDGSSEPAPPLLATFDKYNDS